jgi:hypothetical protein
VVAEPETASEQTSAMEAVGEIVARQECLGMVEPKPALAIGQRALVQQDCARRTSPTRPSKPPEDRDIIVNSLQSIV